MKASGTSLLFEQKGVAFQSIDAVFEGLKDGFEDGFVIARAADVIRYFFIIQGKPYTAAVTWGSEAELHSEVTSIEDFFLWYKSVEAADIEVYKADKKVLLCLLVRISYNPALSFTTDKMGPEEVIENMEGKGKDAVIAVSDAAGESELWHFVIFVGGKVAYTTLLTEDAGGEESPADRLISYIMNADKANPLLVEIYVDTKVAPATDVKEFAEGSIVAQYFGAEGITPQEGFDSEPDTTSEQQAGEPQAALDAVSEAGADSAALQVGEVLKEEDFEELDVEPPKEPEFTEESASDEGSLEELLEELPKGLPDEKPFSSQALPDEFAEFSMEELSDTFEADGAEADEVAEQAEPSEDIFPEIEEETEEVFSGNAPEEPALEAASDALEMGEGFTLEDNSPVGSENAEQASEEESGDGAELIEDDKSLDEVELDATFGQDEPSDITGDVFETPDDLLDAEKDSSEEEGFSLEDTALEETPPETVAQSDVAEAETATDELAVEEEVDETADAPLKADEPFTPLPIEDDISQRQSKLYPRAATLTAKDDTVYTLGSITNIGKEDSSEIKISGMLAAKKLATIVRGKDSFKVVRKGGGKSALKINGDKVEAEQELKDGDTLEAGNLNLKFKVLKT